MWSSISIVIPVYNSSHSLEELSKRIACILSRICQWYEIIMVDDGSKDDSFQKLLQLREQNQRIKIIRLADNFGQQNALICGFHYALGDYIVTIDDDLQHLPQEIEKLLITLDQGYDVVFGIPEVQQQSFYRRLGSKLTGYLFQCITTKPSGIKISSFRIFKKDLLQKIITHQTSFVYISAIIFQYTKNIGNVSVKHDFRKYGRSNYNFFKLINLFFKIYIYYANFDFLKLFRSKKPQFIIRDLRV